MSTDVQNPTTPRPTPTPAAIVAAPPAPSLTDLRSARRKRRHPRLPG